MQDWPVQTQQSGWLLIALGERKHALLIMEYTTLLECIIYNTLQGSCQKLR